MNKKIWLVALLGCLAMMSTAALAQGTRTSRLTFTDPDFPMPGKSITLHYRPAGGPLEGKKNIVGLAYMYNFYKWEIADVDLKSEGDSIWTGEFFVPDTCGFVAFKFQDGLATWGVTTDNNNDKSFGYQLTNEQHEAQPGAYLSWGVFRYPPIDLGVRGYFTDNFKGISLEAMTMWLQKELEIYNGNGRYIYPAMKAVIRCQYPDTYQGGFRYMAETLEHEQNLSERENEMLYFTYKYEIKDSLKADSMHQVLTNLFPKCNTIRWEKFQQINFSGLDAMRQCEDFIAKYPAEDWYRNRDDHDVMYRNTLEEMYKNYKNDSQIDEALRIATHMSFGMLQDEFYHGPQFQIMKAPTDPKEYIQEAETLISLMEKAPKTDYMHNYNCSPKQSEYICNQYLHYNYAVMAMIYERMGRHEDAVKVMEKLDDNERTSWLADGNEAYLKALRALGRNDEAQKELLNAARHNVLTPDMYKELDAYWQTLPKKEQKASMPLWLEDQKLPEVKETAKAELRQQLVNDSIGSFWMENVNGGKLQASDLKKGQILVIDFWALWCAPCINALSGMQMAVDYFKGDPNVRFGFCMTQEDDKDYKTKSNALFARKNFHDMTIYIDHDKTGKAGGQEIFKQMQPNPSGIPCKVVIKDGRVRYRAEGYSGNPAQLLQEIAYVVEILKDEK